ncbi:MAG: exonuclease subunit SbcD [Anaerolineaceae bacterium]|nr:exonuclease subunit SbcD [Anaerolineaceae bacterium]
MDEALRVLHFADLHLGVANHGPVDPQSGLGARAQDFLQRLDDLLALAREHEVDLTVFAGDAFHSRSPNPTLQREFAKRVQAFAQQAPLLLLTGRHDLALQPRRAGSLEIFATLAVPGVQVCSDYEVRQIDTRRGPLAVTTAPWPQRARLLPEARGALSMTELAYALAARLTALAAEADGFDVPRLLVAHFPVCGAQAGSEAGYVPGDAPAVPPDLLADPRQDHVALGYHHLHQDLTQGRSDRPAVVCSGALERLDFSEEDAPRGACLIELARGATRWRFLPLDARPLRSLQLDLRQSAAPAGALQQALAGQQLKGVILRLLLQLSAENEAALDADALHAALRDAGVWHLAGLQREVERPRRRSGTGLDDLDPLPLLQHYLEARDTPPPRQKDLLDAAAGLLREVGTASD